MFFPHGNSPVIKFYMETSKKPAVFKTYAVDQLMLLPPSLEELVPENHISRTINNFVDTMDTR